jgi:ElaB/YqjD/DUF883 family membrane-anchored ribosome-binding protein
MDDAPAAQVVELFAGIDDLIRRVADTENPEIRQMRAKVYTALVAARSSFDRGTAPMRRPASQIVPQTARPIVNSNDEYIEEYPGPVLGIALLVGLGLGLVVSLRQ